MESSLVNNTMLIQIAVPAWLFLGEGLDVRQVVGLGLASAGTLVVQLASAGRSRKGPPRSGADVVGDRRVAGVTS